MNADGSAASSAGSRRWRRPDLPRPVVNGSWLVLAPSATVVAAAAAGWPLWPSAMVAILVTAAVLADFHQRESVGAFGLANGVTLVRLNLTVFLIVAMVADLAFAALSSRLAWTVFLAAAIALVMDGIDGWLARRRHEASSFGERFDMAADTAFTITLGLSLWGFGLTGAWVLAIGLLRPAYLALGHWRPELRTPLAPSRLRKLLCAAALCLLVAALAPPLAGAAPLLAMAALATLLLSFGRDVWHLEASSCRP